MPPLGIICRCKHSSNIIDLSSLPARLQFVLVWTRPLNLWDPGSRVSVWLNEGGACQQDSALDFKNPWSKLYIKALEVVFSQYLGGFNSSGLVFTLLNVCVLFLWFLCIQGRSQRAVRRGLRRSTAARLSAPYLGSNSLHPLHLWGKLFISTLTSCLPPEHTLTLVMQTGRAGPSNSRHLSCLIIGIFQQHRNQGFALSWTITVLQTPCVWLVGDARWSRSERNRIPHVFLLWQNCFRRRRRKKKNQKKRIL